MRFYLTQVPRTSSHGFATVCDFACTRGGFYLLFFCFALFGLVLEKFFFCSSVGSNGRATS